MQQFVSGFIQMKLFEHLTSTVPYSHRGNKNGPSPFPGQILYKGIKTDFTFYGYFVLYYLSALLYYVQFFLFIG